MIQGLVQAADVLTIILAAVVSYLTVPTPAGLQAHAYEVAISIVLAALTFRLTGSYSDAVLFSKVPRVKAVFLGWLAVVGLLLFIDFGLSRTVHVTRSWRSEDRRVGQ